MQQNKYITMVDLSSITPTLREFVRDNINENDLCSDIAVCRGAPVETNHHITLNFGLLEDDISNVFERVGNACRGISPFNVVVSNLSHFHTRKTFDDNTIHEYDILTLDVKDTHSSLVSMHHAIGNAFKMKDERPFSAHVTIAYLEYGKAKEYIEKLGHVFNEGVTIDVNHILIKKFRDRESEPVVLML